MKTLLHKFKLRLIRLSLNGLHILIAKVRKMTNEILTLIMNLLNKLFTEIFGTRFNRKLKQLYKPIKLI